MISRCCWEVTAVTFSTSPPMLTSTVRPVREVHPCTAATTARGPSRVPELDQQPAGHRPEPFRPLRGGLGGERGDRGRIHVEQFGAQPSGQVRQFFRVAVGRRQHLHDQPIHIRDDPTSDDPDPAILSPPAQVNAA
jgi:hypothetical protein